MSFLCLQSNICWVFAIRKKLVLLVYSGGVKSLVRLGFSNVVCHQMFHNKVWALKRFGDWLSQNLSVPKICLSGEKFNVKKRLAPIFFRRLRKSSSRFPPFFSRRHLLNFFFLLPFLSLRLRARMRRFPGLVVANSF